ncbi:hypothetical protein PG996_005772 [Apiospora saccharicola]|uniref:Autophagy protein n=1 Tax=Apiospora saccharicola TaxID=335842 RepID=A0ABR1VR85_9PEZI
MGWWDSLWPSKNEDPLHKLDPKLREYLERESPVKYGAQEQQARDTGAASAKRPSCLDTAAPPSAPRSAEEEAKPTIPKESEFPDGRYAHLWKTYRPLAEIEAETKSDQEKIMDVLEGYKERKAQIGRAALENCALEQVDWRSCMNNPSWSERMTMCRTQVRKFEKCYNTQTRLLKALGYLSTLDRSPEVEEDIQMHADTLYQRLQAQEAEVEAARAEGRPIPKFQPLVPRQPVLGQATAIAAKDELTEEQQAMIKERVAKVDEQDRMAEEMAIRAEIRARQDAAARLQGIYKEQELERQRRKEMGEATTWDKVVGTFKGSGTKDK